MYSLSNSLSSVSGKTVDFLLPSLNLAEGELVRRNLAEGDLERWVRLQLEDGDLERWVRPNLVDGDLERLVRPMLGVGDLELHQSDLAQGYIELYCFEVT